MSSDLQLIKAELLHLPPHGEDRLHQHDHAELVYIVSGSYQVECEGERLTGSAGDVFYYPAHLAHRPQMIGSEVVTTYIIQWREQTPTAQRPRQINDSAGRLLVAIEWLWECSQSEDPEAGSATSGLLAAALYQLRRYLDWEGNDLVRRLRHKLMQSLDYPFTLDVMAMVAGYSKFHFVRLFRELTGTTPMKYLQQLRVERAIELVNRTELSLQEVATKVGFAQADSLSRLIRKQTGKSPSAMRKERISA